MTKKCILGLESPVVIASGRMWRCSNMDTLAPIEDEGWTYLLSNTERVDIWDSEASKNKSNPNIQLISGMRWATDEEKKQYARIKMHRIFKGDKIVINRGRKMLGEVKEVKSMSTFIPDGRNFGPNSGLTIKVTYLNFTDGTRVNVNHCDVIGIDYEPDGQYKGKDLHFRWFCRDDDLGNLFSIGGRY